MTGYFNPPHPAYYNLPINPQYYSPSRFIIANIAPGPTTTVTTTVAHNYVIGQLVRLIISSFYGSSQLNEQLGYVISIPSPTQVTLDLSSQNVNPFIANPAYGPTLPQILAVGDSDSGIISSTGRSVPTTNIPGSFINISPQ